MRCPHCDAADTRVVDSRPVEGGNAIRRRRACEACGDRFTTYERREAVLMVRKRDGRMEPFSAEKVRSGVTRAVADRRIAAEALDDLVAQVEARAEQGGPVVPTEDIGRWVLDALRSLDEVAYLRFASVYKGFEDLADFEREADRRGEQHGCGDRGRQRPAGARERDRRHAADHHEFALREIDDVGGVVDERETERDQRVDRADRQPGKQELQKLGGHPPLRPSLLCHGTSAQSPFFTSSMRKYVRSRPMWSFGVMLKMPSRRRSLWSCASMPSEVPARRAAGIDPVETLREG